MGVAHVSPMKFFSWMLFDRFEAVYCGFGKGVRAGKGTGLLILGRPAGGIWWGKKIFWHKADYNFLEPSWKPFHDNTVTNNRIIAKLLSLQAMLQESPTKLWLML